jgi:hypothetical protein
VQLVQYTHVHRLSTQCIGFVNHVNIEVSDSNYDVDTDSDDDDDMDCVNDKETTKQVTKKITRRDQLDYLSSKNDEYQKVVNNYNQHKKNFKERAFGQLTIWLLEVKEQEYLSFMGTHVQL